MQCKQLKRERVRPRIKRHCKRKLGKSFTSLGFNSMMKKGIPTNGSQIIFFTNFLFQLHFLNVSTTAATT